MNPRDFLRLVVEALDSSGIPHMLTGSFASSFHGTPRSTQDLDIVISPTREGLEKLLTAFPAGSYLDRDTAFEALDRKGMFNLVEPKAGWKADFIILKGRPFSQKEFARRRNAVVFGVPVSIVSPEDLVLAKLEWAAESGSHRQVEDAAGVMRAKELELDKEYLNSWVGKLGLEPEWAKACKAAGWPA